MSDANHSSKARERRERRRQRNTIGDTNPPPKRMRSIRDHLKPADNGSFKWKNIPYLNQILLGLAALAFMGILILAVSVFKDDPPTIQPNALWIGTDWTYQTHEDDYVGRFVRQLDNNQIGTVYARVSELNYDGTWTGRPTGNNQFDEVENVVRTFVSQFKTQAPAKRIYATIHFRVDIGQEDNYRLNNPTIREIVADFSRRMVEELNFDGVLLVVEPVWNENSDDFLELLREVRRSIGNHQLAVAVPPDWTPVDTTVPQASLIASGTYWEREFKQRVALVGADEIVVQAYNSYLNQDEDYQGWMAYQAGEYISMIAELGISTRVVIGIPAYESILPAHDERIENIPNAVLGIQQALTNHPDQASSLYGVALYADWYMDEIKWEQFRANWVNRR
jgi:hypothetical protein